MPGLPLASWVEALATRRPVKLLVWDGSGRTLIYNRLEDGKFPWPRFEEGVMRLPGRARLPPIPCRLRTAAITLRAKASPTATAAVASWMIGKTAPDASTPSCRNHGVHGNVQEWVEDCWNDSYEGAPSDGSAWESGYCSPLVLRGGSWNYDPRYLRSADRSWYDAVARGSVVGFRVARTLR